MSTVLRDLLADRGLSVSEAARRAGVDRSTASSAVNGTKPASLGWFLAFAAGVGIPRDEMLAAIAPAGGSRKALLSAYRAVGRREHR